MLFFSFLFFAVGHSLHKLWDYSLIFLVFSFLFTPIYLSISVCIQAPVLTERCLKTEFRGRKKGEAEKEGEIEEEEREREEKIPIPV